MKRLMKKAKAALGRKLRSKAGETLVETLVTILICVFASVMFAGAVATSTRLNQTAHDEDAEFVGDVMLIETESDCSQEGGTVIMAGDDISGEVSVDYYSAGSFRTYETVSE